MSVLVFDDVAGSTAVQLPRPGAFVVEVERPSVFLLERAGAVKGDPGPPGPKGEALRRWYGDGPPPAFIVGASPGDEYVDTLTGDLYVLS